MQYLEQKKPGAHQRFTDLCIWEIHNNSAYRTYIFTIYKLMKWFYIPTTLYMCFIIVTHKDVEHKFYQSDNWRTLQKSI